MEKVVGEEKKLKIDPFKKTPVDEEIDKFLEEAKLNKAINDEDRDAKKKRLDNYFKINTRERENGIKWNSDPFNPLNKAKLFLLSYKTSMYELTMTLSKSYKEFLINYLKKLALIREKLISLLSKYSTRRHRRYLLLDEIDKILCDDCTMIEDFITFTFHNTGVFKIETFGSDDYAESGFKSPVG